MVLVLRSSSMISGTLRSDKGSSPIQGRLYGDQIRFTAGSMEFSGRVNGDAIEGTSKPVVKETPWRATRSTKL